jgi:CO dehydrogenase maturation factor
MMKMPEKERKATPGKSFSGKRLLICGKGGSGKSSIVVLMANVLSDKGYKVLALDGDASNPGGLARLLLGLKKGPKPLIEFFGGRARVECPVDNPAPLTREGDASSLMEKNIDMAEIPQEYFVKKGDIALLQVGKIREACEGCDGPMSKVTRDFIVKGEQVTLVDVEAGVEHFGRGVERNIDIVFVVVDPTYESFMVAEKVAEFSRGIGVKEVWSILNKVPSPEVESVMVKELEKRKIGILGSVNEDPELEKAGLIGTPLGKSKAAEDVRAMIDELEGKI